MIQRYIIIKVKKNFLFKMTEYQKIKHKRDKEIILGYFEATKEKQGQTWVSKMSKKHKLTHKSIECIIMRKKHLFI